METDLKYTLKQHIALIWRSVKVHPTLSKPVLLSLTLSAIVEGIVPFINLYFSAQILNELAGLRDQGRLLVLAALTVGINLFGLLVEKALIRYREYCIFDRWNLPFKLYTDKALSMDFAVYEDPKVQRAYSQIREHQMGMGFGLSRIMGPALIIVKGLVQIAMSAALAFSLFTLKVPNGSSYGWLDSWWAAAICLAVLAGPVLLAPYLSMQGGKIWAKASNDNNKGNRFFAFYFFDMISGSGAAKDIRIYDQRRMILRHTVGENAGFMVDQWVKYTKYNGKFEAAAAAVTYMCNGLIYLFVALKALAGAFGVGSIVLYAGAITQFGMGFQSVLYQVGRLLSNNPFVDKTFQFLDIPNPMYQGSLTTEKRSDHKYEIEFRDVSFIYPGAEEYALRNVSLRFQVGQRLAIVGQNGSGKTTFIKLLCRLYDPTEGQILLNGIDIRKYRYDEYMNIFSIVFQDFKLLPFELGQNVAAGAAYDREKAAKSLEQAGFGERLASLPKGLDTHLYKNFEEDGVEISGGEAQKIALARALYKDAPFVILDEPTAALDPVAEFEVYSKMNEIVGEKTAVFISHRLSSCRFCSDIAVFHEGRLIQRGSHDALVAEEGGKYCQLWNAQAQYYTDRTELPAGGGGREAACQ